MADDQNQSNTPTQQGPTPAQPLHIPAPQTPVAGAMTAAPLTGAGPHRSEVEKKPPAHQMPKGPPKAPPAAPPKQPPRQTQPRKGTETVGEPPQQQPPAQPVYPQQAMPAAHLQMPAVGMSQGIADPAVASLLKQTLNNQRTQAQKFLLLVLPEDDWPRLHEYEDVNQLITAIKELLGTNCHIFPFLGHKLGITEGPNRFLITPYGPLPLFDIPEPDQIGEAEYGWVGSSLDRPVLPTTDRLEDEEAEDGEDDEDSEVVQPTAEVTVTAEEDPDETPMFDEEPS